MLYKNWFWRWAGVLALALMLAWLAMVATKETKSAVADFALMAQPVQVALPDETFLIPLELPSLEEMQTLASAPLTPHDAERIAAEWTRKAAQPVLDELIRLRAEGLDLTFEIRPEVNAVAITLHDRSLQAQERLVSSGLQIADSAMQACMQQDAAALTAQLLGLSHANTRTTQQRAPTATNPSINVIRYADGWGYIWGYTSANTAVNLRILRNGVAVFSEQRTSDTNGTVYFSPSYNRCPTPGYNWSLRTGDVVELTAGTGAPVQVTVVDLSGAANPQTNTVNGQTAANRSVRINVYRSSSTSCTGAMYEQTVTSNAAGAFSATFSGDADFTGRDYVYVSLSDANDNQIMTFFEPFYVGVDVWGQRLYGTLPANSSYTAEFLRNGVVIAQTTGSTDVSGWYSNYYTKTVYAGDIVRITGNGVSLEYTLAAGYVALNHQTDQIEIWGASGRLVEANLRRRDSSYTPASSCNWEYNCLTFTVPANKGGGGPFATHPAGWDVQRGDRLYVYFYDAQGNHENLYYVNAPQLAISPQYNWLVGYWRDSKTETLQAVLYNAAHEQKARQTIYTDWVGEFEDYFYTQVLPGDIIEVGDGTVTETMTVQNITGRMTTGSDHVTGQAPNGTLLTRWYDVSTTEGYYNEYCTSQSVGATAHSGDALHSAFDVNWAGHPAGMWDGATLQATATDGHATLLYLNAFSVGSDKDDNDVTGYAEIPGATVNATLTRGASVYQAADTADNTGYFYLSFYDGSNPLNIVQGDVLQITANDGNSTNLTIPPFTLLLDGAQNRVYGTTLPNVYVSPGINRPDGRNSWYGWSTSTPTDANGNFSASFDGLYWWNNCAPVNAGEPCAWASGWLYTPQGHRVTQVVQQPAPAPADSFEGDDSPGVAAPYVNPQFHTFHAELEQDWVSLTVSPAAFAAGTSYYIELPQMGPGLRMWVYVYDSTLINTLGLEYFSEGYRNRLIFRPPAAGTYYLKAIPYSNSYTTYCGAFYTLEIRPVTDEIYLPLIQR